MLDKRIYMPDTHLMKVLFFITSMLQENSVNFLLQLLKRFQSIKYLLLPQMANIKPHSNSVLWKIMLLCCST